jgi:hypothetical protein
MACPAFWLEDPSILLTDATEFFPFTEHDKRCTASALNSFTRFGIYLGVVLALVRLEPAWLLVGVAFAEANVVSCETAAASNQIHSGKCAQA